MQTDRPAANRLTVEHVLNLVPATSFLLTSAFGELRSGVIVRCVQQVAMHPPMLLVAMEKGQPPLIESIKKWMRARGIRPEGGTKGFNSLAFVITRRIHQEGTLINRLGERRDIYSSVVTQERIDKIINKIAVAGEVEMLTDLIALYKLK